MAQARVLDMNGAAMPDAPNLFMVDFTVLLVLRGVWVAGAFLIEALIASTNVGPPGGWSDASGSDVESTIYDRDWSWPMCSGNPLWEEQEEGGVQAGGFRSSYVDLAYQLSRMNCGFILERLAYRASGSWRFRVLCCRGEPTSIVHGLHWRYDWIPIHLSPLVNNVGLVTIPRNDLFRVLKGSKRILWENHDAMVWEGFVELNDTVGVQEGGGNAEEWQDEGSMETESAQGDDRATVGCPPTVCNTMVDSEEEWWG